MPRPSKLRLVSFLYSLARFCNDFSKILRGKGVARRFKNKLVGRKIVRKIW